MSSQPKFRGVSVDQEIDKSTRRPDTRTLFKRLTGDWGTTDGAMVFNIVALIIALLLYAVPFSGEIVALCMFFFWLTYVKPKDSRVWNFPYRAPIRGAVWDGSYAKTRDQKTGKFKFRKGDGITHLGKEFGTNLEIWAANSDLRTHNLVLGTTGSGKTELLLGLVFNALVQNSGLVYCDGKGDVSLFDNVFRLARILGRERDLLVLNFITGGRDLAGKSVDKLTNTLNPYAKSSSSMQNELNIGLMDDGGSGGDMWKGRAISFISALSRPLCWLRDRGFLLLDPEAYINHFEMPAIERMVWGKKIIGIGGEEFTIKDPDFDAALKPLEIYLGTLPGYTKANMGKQEQKTLEQHGFITMQLTRTFSDLSFTYGHIFKHQLGDIDFTDVVLNRRILVVLLPSLERAPDSMKALGKLVVGNLKAMMGGSLGSSLEGYRRAVIEARPTLAPVPFYDILDEYGYYAVVGFAVAAAQARSLAHSITFAAQDYTSLERASKEEAAATWENTNVRMVGRLTSGEESDTWRKINGAAGQVEVDTISRKDHRVGDFADTYVTQRDTSSERVGRISYDDLAQQQDGEFHFIVGKKSDGGKRGGVRVIRGRSFYTGQDRSEMHSELRINHFLKVEPPSSVERTDREGLAALIASKITAGEVATQFGGSGGLGGVGGFGGVATTYIDRFLRHSSIEHLEPLHKAMVALTAMSRRAKEDSTIAAKASTPLTTALDQGLAAAMAPAPVAGSSVASAVAAPVPADPIGDLFPVAKKPSESGGSGGLGVVAKNTPAAAVSTSEPMSGTPHVAEDDGAVDALETLYDGWAKTTVAKPDAVADAVRKVEAVIDYGVDDFVDDGYEEPEPNVDERAEVVVQAVVNGNRYAEAPIPPEVTMERMEDLLKAAKASAAGGAMEL